MPADVDRRDEFHDVAHLIRRSMLFGLLQTIVGVADAAVQRSRLVAAMRAGAWRFVQLPSEERVRSISIFGLVAAITEFAITAFLPARSAPALPRAIWVVIAIAATLPSLMPAAVLNAWLQWKSR